MASGGVVKLAIACGMLLLALLNPVRPAGVAAPDCGECNKNCIGNCTNLAPIFCDTFCVGSLERSRACADCKDLSIKRCSPACYTEMCAVIQGCPTDVATLCSQCRSKCEVGCLKPSPVECASTCNTSPSANDPCASVCESSSDFGPCKTCRSFVSLQPQETCEECETRVKATCTAGCLASDCATGLGCLKP